MNGNDHNGLDKIWPRVRVEIESERCKAVRRRQTLRRTVWGLGGLAAAGFVVVFAAGIWGTAPDDANATDSWQVTDISPTTDNRSEYPLVQGDAIFALRREDNRQRVICVERLTGRVKWKSGQEFQDCRLAADTRRVYALGRASESAWLCVALEPATGKTLWSRALNGSAAPPPSALTVIPAGICWTRKGELVLQDCETGEVKWAASPGAGETLSGPVEHNGMVFVASRSQLYALDSDTGDCLWSRPMAKDSAAFAPLPPFLKTSGDKLLVAFRTAPTGGVLLCVDPATHEVVWRRQTPAPINLHADAERVYLRAQTLAAYDARTGKKLWTANVGGCGPVAFRDGRLYLADPKGRYNLLALDVRSGKPIWRHSSVASCAGIVIHGETGFVSGRDGRLHAFVLSAARTARGRQFL